MPWYPLVCWCHDERKAYMCRLLRRLVVHDNQFPKYLHEPTFVAFHDVEVTEIGTQYLGDLEI